MKSQVDNVRLFFSCLFIGGYWERIPQNIHKCIHWVISVSCDKQLSEEDGKDITQVQKFIFNVECCYCICSAQT